MDHALAERNGHDRHAHRSTVWLCRSSRGAATVPPTSRKATRCGRARRCCRSSTRRRCWCGRKVNQADLPSCGRDMPVIVRLDAYPDLQMPGHIATAWLQLACPGSFSTRVRAFTAVVTIEGSNARLLPDLTAAIDVEVERIKDALVVPRVGRARRTTTRAARPRPGRQRSRARHRDAGAGDEVDVVVTAGLHARSGGGAMTSGGWLIAGASPSWRSSPSRVRAGSRARHRAGRADGGGRARTVRRRRADARRDQGRPFHHDHRAVRCRRAADHQAGAQRHRRQERATC